MNAKQTKLIEQAATVDVDGEGWRKRMDAWLDSRGGLSLAKLIEAKKLLDANEVRSTGRRMWYRGFEYIG